MPDTSTEIAIATTTLSSATTTITFNSIPGTYTDLRLVFTSKTSSAGESGYIRFNSDSGANYSVTFIAGEGSVAFSNRETPSNQICITDNQAVGSSTTIPQLSTVDVFSYTGSTFKTLLNSVSADQNGSGGTISRVGLWRNTSAITRIDVLTLTAATFSAGTTATLYGIL
jgi:hypothetical protein